MTRTNSKGEPLRIRTREEYQRLLNGPLAEFLPLMLGAISPARVRTWRSALMAEGNVTQTSRAYSLLSSIISTAVQDGIATSNPCQIKSGHSTTTGKAVKPPTDDELATMLKTITPEYRAIVIVAAVGGLRFGEATELRANSVNVECDDNGAVTAVRLSITQAVVKTATKGRLVGEPKSAAGVRTLAIFGEDAEILADHVQGKTGNALLFPAADGTSHLSQSTLWRHWNKARVAAGRKDLPFHGLRHYAGTRYAQAGATTSETMARLGHSSVKAAMRYQHSGNRDDELAARMSRRTKA
nr:tyrosine-type recombinase/integrase [Paenarthrobacter nitroguajacolicus]